MQNNSRTFSNTSSLLILIDRQPTLSKPNPMKHTIAFLFITCIHFSNAIVYRATNNAANTTGGDRFNSEIGLQYSIKTLVNASSFIWETFNQSETERKNVTVITLTIESMEGVACTDGNNGIHMSEEYIGNYSGDVKVEFTGLMFHETTHVWQWDGEGKAPSGLVEGVADFVRLRAGYEAGNWVKPGEGERWDQGDDVTARFLDYCEGKKSGFVGEINGKMKDGYSDGFFEELLGSSVDDVWKEYKEKYGG